MWFTVSKAFWKSKFTPQGKRSFSQASLFFSIISIWGWFVEYSFWEPNFYWERQIILFYVHVELFVLCFNLYYLVHNVFVVVYVFQMWFNFIWLLKVLKLVALGGCIPFWNVLAILQKYSLKCFVKISLMILLFFFILLMHYPVLALTLLLRWYFPKFIYM